jgi:sporulation protein YlmC with PRC-barrel domain
MTEALSTPQPAAGAGLRSAIAALVLSGTLLTGAPTPTVAQTAAPSDATIQTPPAASGIDDEALSRSARASKLIGSEVYSAGDDIGKIEDLLIDREHAAVTGAIVSVGGLLGIGEKRIAVPITAIKLGNEAKFTIDLSKDDLKNAPVFDYARLK